MYTHPKKEIELGLQLMFLSGLLMAFANLCLRRSIDSGGTSKAYLMMQLGLAVIVMTLLGPVRTGDFHWDPAMGGFAVMGGILLASVMTFLGKALETGPPGLSVAMLNCSSVVPILMLVILFGSQFGFEYTLWNAIGSILVIMGICWAGWDTDGVLNTTRKKWLLFISICFVTHVAYLVFLNWRALFINFPNQQGLGLAFSPEAANMQWFMPVVFATAAIVQGFLFFTQEKRLPNHSEVSYGLIGSIVHGVGSFCMIRATEVATSLEQAMLFPIFSVTIIVGCNLWGKWLYHEQVNWKANAVCIGGILLGTVDWSVIFK